MRARLRLVAGDLAAAEAALGEDDPSAAAIGLAGWVRLAAAVERDLLAGDTAAALARLAAAAIPPSPSLLGALLIDLRIRAALLAGDPERLRGAERDLALLRRSPIPAAGALAAGLAASLAAFAGDRGAGNLLAPAAEGLARAGLHLRAAALRWRAARLGGPTSATAEVRGAVDLAALAAVSCPWPAAAPAGT
ncbi:MAG: hypothetical protein R3B09_19445, partial [Nannocystaceae bacterium]